MVFLILLFILIYLSRIIYLKYLVILVYVRGIVVLILYISCICWNINEKFSILFVGFGLSFMYLFDLGVFIKFSDIGDFLWIYIFFSVIFRILVTVYSLNLFKVSGSLRF